MNLWRVEDDQVRLAMHPGQLAAWDSEARFTFVLSGTQGGKTSWSPWWLWRQIQRCGPGDYLAVTASFDLFKLKMLPEMRMVYETLLGVARFWSGARILELKDPETGQFWAKRADDPMWGRIILRSAQSSGGLESATANAAWLDECGQDEFRLEDWEAVLRRLSLAQGRALGTTTLYNVGWIKSEVYDRWADGDPDYEVIQFPSVMNPAFPPEEYERAERSLPAWRFAMFYRGEFARPEGLIYGAFTEGMLIDPFPIPLDWERVTGVDFGGANTALMWLACDPTTGMWYAYRESLAGGRSTPEHVGAAQAVAVGSEDIRFVGGGPSETQERRDWSHAGLWVEEPAISGVEAGIDRVTQLIRTDRLRIFRSLRGLRDELGSYRRKLDGAGNVTDQIVDKRGYHRLDALRYAVSLILRERAVAPFATDGGRKRWRPGTMTSQPRTGPRWGRV